MMPKTIKKDKKKLAAKLSNIVSSTVPPAYAVHKQLKNNENAMTSLTKALGKTALTVGGGLIGGAFGAPTVGADAGAYFSKLLGMGSYKVNSNSIMRSSEQAPQFGNTEGAIVIEHSEFVTDVLSNQKFTSQTFALDPTNRITFPYLALVAQNFEQFSFQGLVFTYKPTSGSAIASTNNSLGTVILATEYDVSKDIFASKTEMEAYEFATSCVPSSGMLHPVECAPAKDILRARYINNTRLEPGDYAPGFGSVENNLSNLGRTQLSVVGMQANNITVGELWVSYKIRLSKPRIPGPSNYQGFYHAASKGANLVNGGGMFGATGSYYVTNDSLGTTPVVIADPNKLSIYGLATGNVIQINYVCKAGGGTFAFGGVGSLVNAASYNNSFLATTGLPFTDNTFDTTGWLAAGGNFQYTVLVTNSVPGPVTINFNAPTIVGGTSFYWDLKMYVLPIVSTNANNGIVLSSTSNAEVEARMAKLECVIGELLRGDDFETVTQTGTPSVTPVLRRSSAMQSIIDNLRVKV
jgi:hypothetical protein